MLEKKIRNDEIIRLLGEGLTYGEVASKVGVTKQRVEQIARARQMPPRGPRTGAEHPHWNGGVKQDKDGYTRVYVAPLTYADPFRVLAEAKMGRKLTKGEKCIAIDGDRSNLHPDNVRVLSASAFSRFIHLKHNAETVRMLYVWFAIRKNRRPKSHELQSKEFPVNHHLIYKHFGGLNEIAVDVGLEPPGRGAQSHGGSPLPRWFVERWTHLKGTDAETIMRQYGEPAARRKKRCDHEDATLRDLRRGEEPSHAVSDVFDGERP
jgi:hypothetical protein